MIVLRLWRWDAARLAADAELDRRQRLAAGESDPPYSVSVFALEPEDGEELEDTVTRLYAAAKPFRRAKWAAITTTSELATSGFEVQRNEPPPHHHDVMLSNSPDNREYEALATVFDKERSETNERRPFA